MKKIRFKKLRLLNFCGIRQGEYEFNEHLTIISGGNGKGKSTIFRAIFYVLFETDEKGNSFEIKTFDKEHNIIPEIPHEAELFLSVDGEEYILKRSLSDKWNGKECKNSYRYFVNDEVCTAGEFKRSVDNICPEITFRLCASANDFVSRPWQEQRKFLQQLIGEISPDTITEGDKKYDFVLEALKKQDIETYVHHLKYRRSEVQKQLDEIPVRLSELNKALPEAEDWDALQAEHHDKTMKVDDLVVKIASINNGGAEQVRKDEIRKQLEIQRKRIDTLEKNARNAASEEATKHQSDIITSKTALSKAESIVEELKAKMEGFTDTELHIKKQIEELDEKNKKGGKDYESVSLEVWHWDDNDSFCPHCGQPLPVEKLLSIKRASERNFNERKSEKLKSLMQLAADIKTQKVECQSLLDQLSEERKTTTNQLTEAHKALREAETFVAKVEKEAPRDYQVILFENESYKQASSEVQRLEEELNKPVVKDDKQNDLLASLEKQLEVAKEKTSEIQTKLSRRESFDKVSSLIEECKKNKVTYQNQLDEIDEKLDIATDYYQLSCNILEEEVNKHFKYVRWTMFKSNLDGDKKPYCECYHDGVPYSRLNGAAKVNAGIDIAYTIAKFYDVSVPLVLDECESNLSPIYEGGQQIRLSVAPLDELTFTYED